MCLVLLCGCFAQETLFSKVSGSGNLWLAVERFGGQASFCLERWDFWKGRFGAIVKREDVNEVTESWADDAVIEVAVPLAHKCRNYDDAIDTVHDSNM